jgi:hypothetical protein
VLAENEEYRPPVSKELQYLQSLAARTGVLDDDDIIGLGSELFGALCQVQNKIGSDSELPFLKLLQAAVYRVCVTVNE